MIQRRSVTMRQGSKNSGYSASKSVANVVSISSVPVKTTVTIKGGKGGGEVTMRKGSKNSGYSTSKSVANVGSISSVPVKTTVTIKGGKGGGEGSYANKSRITYANKQTGCYGRATMKEKASAGEFHSKNGTTGTKREYKKSSTIRIGDKSGYTEVYNEQTVRHVSYNKSSYNKNFITYGNGDGGEYVKFGYIG
ncbi:hypothetical protein L2E82_12219 [Cichorium intybus]|uniref:Uncharacterized protein n=1 Tax=Cichorium intybus TaxID=13427 RepID=A0ACB9GEY4_CICIN|nr:hypothetical protein L2E82_12219 [Cichorium intybus]